MVQMLDMMVQDNQRQPPNSPINNHHVSNMNCLLQVSDSQVFQGTPVSLAKLFQKPKREGQTED